MYRYTTNHHELAMKIPYQSSWDHDHGGPATWLMILLEECVGFFVTKSSDFLTGHSMG